MSVKRYKTKRFKTTSPIVCLATTWSLIGQTMIGEVCVESPKVSARPSAVTALEPAPATNCPSAWQSTPTDSGPTCASAAPREAQFLLKESDRTNPATIGSKATGRIAQAARITLRAPGRSADSHLLWIEMVATSLSARKVRLQI
jgi:hypothetical protein